MMNVETIIIDVLNVVFFGYAVSLFIFYVLSAYLSARQLRKHISQSESLDYKSMLDYTRLPTISIIAPAYNEAMTIIENINCLLNIKYSDFEIIVVNDGSKDDTLAKVITHFEMMPSGKVYSPQISTSNVRNIYISRNSAYNHLIVIDKENGGKADALNTGINVAQGDLFLAMDVDCIVESDALLHMVRPFIEDSDAVVVATGGVVRVANSCEVDQGKVVKVRFPKNIWAAFQVLEYFRAFTLGRMAWARINGLLIISGAFGLFDRKRVLAVGGYDRTTVGEDLELVVRLRRYMYEVEKRKHRVAFIPDPLCWTEVPESTKILSRQRNRWMRGAIETIQRHRKMILNPRYGIVGMLSFPFWVLFEWMAPIIQLAGILYVVFLTLIGYLNVWVFLTMAAFVLSFAVMYSFFGILFEAMTYYRYREPGYLLKSLLLSVVEMFVYQPMNMYYALTGNYDIFISKKQKHWGDMTRKGFTKKT